MSKGGPRGILYVMAKAPAPGRVKTRLCPPLDPARAARLAAAFAGDLLQRLSADGGFEVRLALDGTQCPGGDGEPDLRSVAAAARIEVEGQGDGDLGERMQRLVARGLAAQRSVVLVGSDVPDLPLRTVRAAFEALSRVDAVLAPSSDGGYVLVGARRRIVELFSIDVPWSSAHVMEATRRALARGACSFETLEPWDDVDDAAALGRLAARLDADGGLAAPSTSSLIRQWRREGIRF